MLLVTIEDIGGIVGLTSADLQDTIVTTINIILALLSLVSLFMLVIGGFRWVVSGNSDEFREQAKRTIVRGLVGQIVVLVSWAVIVFVTSVVQL